MAHLVSGACPDIIVEPFTAAGMQQLPAEERDRRLTRLGVRHLRLNGLLQWDGSDLARGYSLASTAYQSTLAQITSRAKPRQVA